MASTPGEPVLAEGSMPFGHAADPLIQWTGGAVGGETYETAARCLLRGFNEKFVPPPRR
jgi:hypothetical protein